MVKVGMRSRTSTSEKSNSVVQATLKLHRDRGYKYRASPSNVKWTIATVKHLGTSAPSGADMQQQKINFLESAKLQVCHISQQLLRFDMNAEMKGCNFWTWLNW